MEVSDKEDSNTKELSSDNSSIDNGCDQPLLKKNSLIKKSSSLLYTSISKYSNKIYTSMFSP